MTQLRFDTRCNNKLFAVAIRILSAMTCVKWGFMRRRRRVQYISSIEIPLHIGTITGKPYEKNITRDYNIINKPANFTHDIWIEHLTCELKTYMNSVITDKVILANIALYCISTHTATLYDDAAEYNSKYANILIDTTDAWLLGTEFILTDEIAIIEDKKMEELLGDW